MAKKKLDVLDDNVVKIEVELGDQRVSDVIQGLFSDSFTVSTIEEALKVDTLVRIYLSQIEERLKAVLEKHTVPYLDPAKIPEGSVYSIDFPSLGIRYRATHKPGKVKRGEAAPTNEDVLNKYPKLVSTKVITMLLPIEEMDSDEYSAALADKTLVVEPMFEIKKVK